METRPFFKFHFESGKPEADEACSFCQTHYGQHELEQANIHVVLGGDGSVLSAIHKQIEKGIDLPIFALNYGSVGRMCNHPNLDDLPRRIQSAQTQEMIPLKLTATSAKNGEKLTAYAINEFSVLRESPQAAHLLLTLKDKNFMYKMPVEGDGVILATPMGSSGYYANIEGEKKPIPEKFLGLRSVNSKTHLDLMITEHSKIAVNKKQGQKRPIMIEGDGQRFSDISRAVISSAFDKKKTLLFEKYRQNQR